MRPKPYHAEEKRAELLSAAAALFHERGMERTTLAEVAERAQVRPGNMYYYFKSKEALVESVVGLHVEALVAQFERWTQELTTPRARLRRLMTAPIEQSDSLLSFGCAHGKLCQELEKVDEGSKIHGAGRRLMEVHLAYAEEQFRELGFGKREARERAGDLVSSIQGISLVAYAMDSKEFLTRQLRLLERRVLDLTGIG